MLFRKSLYEIKSEYKEANMKNENFEMYHEVEKVLANKIERTDKVEKQYNRQERNKKYYEKRYENAKEEMKKLREKYPVRTLVARIPLIGRFGKVAKEYNRLREKAKRCKTRAKIAKKTLKDLEPVCKKYNKEIKLTTKDLKRCERAIKRDYKIDKNNVEIAKMYKTQKDLLKMVYDKSTFNYIKEYVARVQNGERDIELPQGVESEKAFVEMMKKDIKNATKGKKVNLMVKELENKDVENKDIENKENKENKSQEQRRNNKTIFAQKGLDIKREYVTYKQKTEDSEIKLDPEEVLNYIGFISKNPDILEEYSKEEVVSQLKGDEEYAYVNRGWDVLHDMIENLRDEQNQINVKDLSKSEKVVYKVASKYLEKEQKAMENAKKDRAKDDKQQLYA